ncbi:xylene monooxygenase [bacterium]|nr:MAG: xylene monooxygenase [bacterium]
MKEYTTTVTEVISRTPTCKSVRMESPSGFQYQPGQWAKVTPLPENNVESKPLSFSSSPTEPYLEFTKRISQSDFSAVIDHLVPGDTVRFRGPAGNLICTGTEKRVVFIAGGIGITPVRSILRYLYDQEISGEHCLLYANSNIDEIAFGDEFEKLQDEKQSFKIVNILADPPEGWKGHRGFLTLEIIRECVPDIAEQTVFLCGPPKMVECLEEYLAEMKVPADQIRKERLEGYEEMV